MDVFKFKVTLLALLCISDMTTCLSEETAISYKFPLCEAGTTNAFEDSDRYGCHCPAIALPNGGCGCNSSNPEHSGPIRRSRCDLICICPSSPYRAEDIRCCDPYRPTESLIAASGEIISQPYGSRNPGAASNPNHIIPQGHKYVLALEWYSDSSCSNRTNVLTIYNIYLDEDSEDASKCHHAAGGDGVFGSSCFDSRLLCNPDGSMNFYFYFPPNPPVGSPTCNGPASRISDGFYPRSVWYDSLGADVMNGACYLSSVDYGRGGSYTMSNLSNVTLPDCEKATVVGYKFLGFGTGISKYGHPLNLLSSSLETTPEQCRAWCSSLDACVGYNEFSYHTQPRCVLYVRSLTEMPSTPWRWVDETQHFVDPHLGLWHWHHNSLDGIAEVGTTDNLWDPDLRGPGVRSRVCYKKLYRCSKSKFGIDLCNNWCNTPGYWGCDAYTLAGTDVKNTDNLDYTCSCAGCNGCAESASPYAINTYGLPSCVSGYVPIISESSCIAAAAFFGLHYSKSEESPGILSGCSKKKDNMLYFNGMSTGQANPEFAPVCMEAAGHSVKVSLILEGNSPDAATFAANANSKDALKLALSKHLAFDLFGELNLTLEEQCLQSDQAGGKAIVTVEGAVSMPASAVSNYIESVAHMEILWQEHSPLRFRFATSAQQSIPELDLRLFKVVSLTAVPLSAAMTTTSTTKCATSATGQVGRVTTTSMPDAGNATDSSTSTGNRGDQEVDVDNCQGCSLVTGFFLTIFMLSFGS